MAISETIQGIIIGGLIGALPTVSTVLIESRKQKRQQKHELLLRKIEMLEAPRLAALKDYSEKLGVLCAGRINADSISEYMVAHSRAIMYVSADTRLAMMQVSDALLPYQKERIIDDFTTASNMVSDPNFMRLSDCLKHEMDFAYTNIQNDHPSAISQFVHQYISPRIESFLHRDRPADDGGHEQHEQHK